VVGSQVSIVVGSAVAKKVAAVLLNILLGLPPSNRFRGRVFNPCPSRRVQWVVMRKNNAHRQRGLSKSSGTLQARRWH
jgi:hypothetical protein